MAEKGIIVAAFADTQLGNDDPGHYGTIEQLGKALHRANGEADIFLFPGDITEHGTPQEAEAFLEILQTSGVTVPVVVTTGNHDRDRYGSTDHVVQRLRRAQIPVIDDDYTILDIRGMRVGLVGINPTLQPQEHKALIVEYRDHAKRASKFHALTERDFLEKFRRNLNELRVADVDVVIVMSHIPFSPQNYGPPESSHHTILYELSPQFPALADEMGVNVIFAGHAHARRGSAWSGNREGYTNGGTPSRNAAIPIGIEYGHERIYDLYEL